MRGNCFVIFNPAGTSFQNFRLGTLFLCMSMICHEGALPSSSSRGPGPLKTDLYRNQCFLFQRVTIVTTVNFVCFDCKRCQTYKQVALWVKPPCWVSLP